MSANNFIYIYKKMEQDRKRLRAEVKVIHTGVNQFKKAVHIKTGFKRYKSGRFLYTSPQ